MRIRAEKDYQIGGRPMISILLTPDEAQTVLVNPEKSLIGFKIDDPVWPDLRSATRERLVLEMPLRPKNDGRHSGNSVKCTQENMVIRFL